jgi:serine/threonine-protein kinase HipA
MQSPCLLSQSVRFLLPEDEARAIVTEMKDRVKTTWYEVARSVSVSEKDCGRVAGAFAYPGLDLGRVEPVDDK